MGTRALKRGRIGTAMAWGLKSQDARFTTFLADQLLKHYCESGTFSSADLLDNLGSCMVVSERLTFLAKYREFHRLRNHGEFKEAATLLHSLLWSRLAPKYFWVTLLIDAIPFLADARESNLMEDHDLEVYFTSEQTYELMHCLQVGKVKTNSNSQITVYFFQELSSEQKLPKKQLMMLEEYESQIRMKLARNLAESLMNEGQEG